MADKKSKLNRRKILKTSAAGMAATSGLVVGNATGESGDSQVKKRDRGHRVGKDKQDRPNYRKEEKIGFSKGGFRNRISEGTINQLYTEVIGKNSDRRFHALPRPTKKERPNSVVSKRGGEVRELEYEESDVFGVVVSMENGNPYIHVHTKPVGTDSMSRLRKKNAEARIHKEIDQMVKQRANSNRSRGE